MRVRAGFVLDVVRSLRHWWFGRRSPGARAEREPRRAASAITWTELRQVVRGITRRPGYSVIVIATLGIGIGATTTLYSVVDAMLVRALPYPHADRLVLLGNVLPERLAPKAQEGLLTLQRMSAPNVRDLQAKLPDLASVAMLERRQWLSNQGQDAAPIEVANVTPEFFQMLGVKPRLGRLLGPGDHEQASGVPALISYDGWQGRFGGDPAVVGHEVMGGQFTIVGVLPRSFRQPQAIVEGDVEFFIYLDPTERRYNDRQRHSVRVLAQLRPGASEAQVRRELDAAQAQLMRDEPAGNLLRDGTPVGTGLNTLRDATVGSAARPTLVLLGAALLVLLLAGMNAANLLLVRGLERSGDVAIRRALGAGRGRIVVSHVAEGIGLAMLGGLVGLLMARLGVAAFQNWGPQDLPRLHEVAVNRRIALAGVLLSIVVGGAIGLIPALRAGHVAGLASMRVQAGVLTRESARLRSVLAATQLALALVLGVGASLLFRSFAELRAQPLGFQPHDLQTFFFPWKTDQIVPAWGDILEAVQSTPGVTHAGITSSVPLQRSTQAVRVERADQPGSDEGVATPSYVITPGYLALTGVPLRRGREFTDADRPDTRAVCIISESLARARFGNADPLGQVLRLTDESGSPPQSVEVVGVSGDAVQSRVEDGLQPAIYLPYTQSGPVGLNVVLSSAREPGSLLPDIRYALASAGYGRVPPMDFASMDARVAATRAVPRFQTALVGGFALSALLLAAVGIMARSPSVCAPVPANWASAWPSARRHAPSTPSCWGRECACWWRASSVVWPALSH